MAEKIKHDYFNIRDKEKIASAAVSYLLAKISIAPPKETAELSKELRKWYKTKV